MTAILPSLPQVLRLYAILTATGAVMLLIRTPESSYLSDKPYVASTILYLIGALLVVSATFAFAQAKAPDRTALNYFLAGQWIAVAILIAKYHAVFDYQLPVAPAALMVHSLLLLTLWRIFYWSAPLESLQERLAAEIRRAASREERHRLARDLHDSIKQHVFAIQTAAATAQQAPQPAAAIEQVRESARDVMTELDVMLDQLNAEPLTFQGFATALSQLAETTRLRTGAAVQLRIEALPSETALPAHAPRTLLRIAQEALSNVARHARAKSVRIELTADELRIVDDGAGFAMDASPPGMGLRNLRVRAEEVGGQAQITSAPGQGTRVRITWKIPPAPASIGVPWIQGGVLAAAFALLSANPEAPQPMLNHALRGAIAVFLVLYLVRKRRLPA